MYPVSDALRNRVTLSHARRSRLTVLDSALVPVPGGIVTPDAVTGGQVYVSAGSGARRTCNVTFSNKGGIYTPQAVGDLFYWNRMVLVEQGIVVIPGNEDSVEWVPLGVFMVDRPSTLAEQGGVLTMGLTGRDRWKMIDSAEYDAPGTYASGTKVDDVLRAAATYAGVSDTQIITSSATHTLGVDRHYEEGDSVGDLMTKVANDFGMRVYFNVGGYLVIEDIPRVADRPVVHVYEAGARSIMSKVQRDLTDERFANHVVVSSASSDPNAPPPIRATAEDTRPGSPTAVGEIGRRTYRYSSPLITSAAVAQDVADKLLEARLRFSVEVSVEAVSLPYLDGDDRATVQYPEIGLGTGSTFLIESASLPLSDATGTLRLTAAEDVSA